jgi:predicted dehydrogenase
MKVERVTIMGTIRIGIVGLGANSRLRHLPGFRACPDVEITAVCNRRPESTQQAAREFDIPRTFEHWQDLVTDDAVDAVLVGTWPYLHCAVTLKALASGKHVLTEARMARNLTEAKRMQVAAAEHNDLVTQIVPSPLGLRAGRVVERMLNDGYLGELREFIVTGTNADLVDPKTPLHWRQSTELSGWNSLALGILHETLIRWLPNPIGVFASTHVYTPNRTDPDTGCQVRVHRPDSVHILTRLPSGARGIYHLSGGIHHGPGLGIQLFGSEGAIRYDFAPTDQLFAARGGEDLREIDISEEEQGTWQVEADFIEAIRTSSASPNLTDFATGVRYMEFTEAVEISAQSGQPVSLPLPDPPLHSDSM